jgi:hypothetical protein
VIVRFQRWLKRRRRQHEERNSSWLDCRGNADRSAAQSRWTLRLYKTLMVCLFPLKTLQSDIITAMIAPQNDRRFWQGIKVDIPQYWITRRDFEEILDDDPGKEFESPQQIFNWLRRCRYVTDLKLFGEEDYWQLPSELEKRRKGDCEDFALWAWYHLRKFDSECRFVFGRCNRSWLSRGYHAWVVFTWRNEPHILDGGRHGKKRILIPAPEARKDYLPFFSVDYDCQIYWHG